jgi:hypothetical protein
MITLETDRLILRPWTLDEFRAIRGGGGRPTGDPLPTPAFCARTESVGRRGVGAFKRGRFTVS